MEIMAKCQGVQNSDSEKLNEQNEQLMPTGEVTSQSEEQCSTPPVTENVGGNTDAKSKKDLWPYLDKQLVQSFKKCRPDREVPAYACSNHEKLKITSVKWAEEDITSSPFNEKGLVTNEWLREFLERYKTAEQVITEEVLTSEPLEVEETAAAGILRPEHVEDTARIQVLPILTPAQADAVFLYDASDENPGVSKPNFESAPDLKTSEPSIDTHPIKSNMDTSVNLGQSQNRNPLFRRGTFEMAEETDCSHITKKPAVDLIRVAASVPLPPSRQTTFDSINSVEAPGSKSLAMQKISSEDIARGQPVANDSPPAEQIRTALDPIFQSKVDRVISMYNDMRGILADDAVGVLRNLAQSEVKVTRGVPGLDKAIDDAAARWRGGSEGSEESNSAIDRALVALRIKVWMWDAAFDVVQHVLLDQRIGDLVPDYDLDRLLRTQNRIVTVQNLDEQEESSASEQQPEEDQARDDAVTVQAVEASEQQ
jgi:hypothetical protein